MDRVICGKSIVPLKELLDRVLCWFTSGCLVGPQVLFKASITAATTSRAGGMVPNSLMLHITAGELPP